MLCSSATPPGIGVWDRFFRNYRFRRQARLLGIGDSD